MFDEGTTAAPEAGLPASPKLAELVARARKEGRLTNVVQFVDEELLRVAFHSLRKQAAPGVDGQSYEEYAAGLDENLWDLYKRLKSGRYRAPVIRRVYIPKANGKLRALGITTIEDRVVQRRWPGSYRQFSSKISWSARMVSAQSGVRTRRYTVCGKE